MRIPPFAAFLLGLASTLLLSACEQETAGEEGILVVDSAGIVVVEHSPAALAGASRWALAAVPEVELGALNGPEEHLLFDVNGARLVGTRIWIMNRGTRELRGYGMDGSHLVSRGREGEGPGEFKFPLGLEVLDPDTLVVWDHQNRRISYFNISGGFLRSVQIMHAFMNPDLLALFSDGTFLFRDLWALIPTSPGIEEMSFTLLRFGQDGVLADSLGTAPAGQLAKVDPPPGFSPVAFSPAATFGGTPSGYWLSTTVRPELEFRDPTGKVLSRVRWDAGDRTVQPPDATALVQSMLDEIEDEEMRREREGLFSAMPVAEEFPALDRLEVDRIGNVWIRMYPRPRDRGPHGWLVFSPTGRIRATIDLPRELDVLDIGEDYVLGRTRGDFDEEYVRLYRIQKNPTTP